ncbi:hypothetical protein EBB06_10430 [Crenobacter cavernae]|uniref:Uncharacterized protein n=1 Tax=Crenobacter cavernae TaxID=2290923 RepID=A0ABY0FBH1_9NEIS|nr:hypothetical protein EBB06_10430 [Crenobacter cavernae]
MKSVTLFVLALLAGAVGTGLYSCMEPAADLGPAITPAPPEVGRGPQAAPLAARRHARLSAALSAPNGTQVSSANLRGLAELFGPSAPDWRLGERNPPLT